MVDGCLSKLVTVVSGVSQGSILGLVLFILYISVLFSILEDQLIGYEDESILKAVLAIPRRYNCSSSVPETVTSARLVSGVTFVL